MNILQIIPDLSTGGAEKVVQNLSIELRNNSHSVEVISLYSKKTDISSEISRENINIDFMDKKPGFDLSLVFKLRKKIKKSTPNVVHTHLYALPYVVLATLFLNIPCKIHTVHSIANKEVSKKKQKIYKIIFKYFKFIPVAISPKIRESISNTYGFELETIPLVYNGIKIDGNLKKKNYAIDNNIPKIIHVGNFKEAKNHTGLIDTVFELKKEGINSNVYLLGSGSLEESIINKVNDLGMKENFTFKGNVKDVLPIMLECDIFVLPSNWEGMPISLIEAMSVGMPILATNVGGIPDMIENTESGILVENSLESLIYGFKVLLENEENRKVMGNKAFECSKKFNSSTMADNYIQLYKTKVSQNEN